MILALALLLATLPTAAVDEIRSEALALEAAGRRVEALELRRRLVASLPEDASARRALSILLLKLGRSGEAAETAIQAPSSTPGRVELLAAVAESLAMTDQRLLVGRVLDAAGPEREESWRWLALEAWRKAATFDVVESLATGELALKKLPKGSRREFLARAAQRLRDRNASIVRFLEPRHGFPGLVPAESFGRDAGLVEPALLDFPGVGYNDPVESHGPIDRRLVLELLVDAEGRVRNVVPSAPRLGEEEEQRRYEIALTDNLRRWRLRPATRDGVPVPCEWIISWDYLFAGSATGKGRRTP